MNFNAANRKVMLPPLVANERSKMTITWNKIMLAITITIASTSPVAAQESQQFKHEDDKLKTLRKILTQKKFSPTLPPEPTYCTQFMRDLLADSNVEAVEPDVRADSADDSQLKEWRHCDGAAGNGYEGPNRKNRELDDGFHLSETPPYRSYQIDLDDNSKNGKENLLFQEAAQDKSAGYTWVNLKSCIVAGEVWTPWSTKTPPIFKPLNLVAHYKGEYLVLNLEPNTTESNISNYHFVMTKLSKKHRPLLCSWSEPIVETTRPSIGGKTRKPNKTTEIQK